MSISDLLLSSHKATSIGRFNFCIPAARAIPTRHDTAVCLMRLGRFTEAVEILRKLVLNHDVSGCGKTFRWYTRRTSSMALLLGGHPAGCESMLAELDDETNSCRDQDSSDYQGLGKINDVLAATELALVGNQPANKPVLYDGVVGDFETVLVEHSQTKSLNHRARVENCDLTASVCKRISNSIFAPGTTVP